MILIMHHSLLVNSKEVAIGTRLLVAAIDGVGVTIVSPPIKLGSNIASAAPRSHDFIVAATDVPSDLSFRKPGIGLDLSLVFWISRMIVWCNPLVHHPMVLHSCGWTATPR